MTYKYSPARWLEKNTFDFFDPGEKDERGEALIDTILSRPGIESLKTEMDQTGWWPKFDSRIIEEQEASSYLASKGVPHHVDDLSIRPEFLAARNSGEELSETLKGEFNREREMSPHDGVELGSSYGNKFYSRDNAERMLVYTDRWREVEEASVEIEEHSPENELEIDD